MKERLLYIEILTDTRREMVITINGDHDKIKAFAEGFAEALIRKEEKDG